MAFSETMALATFIVVAVATAFALAQGRRRIAGREPWSAFGELRTEVREIAAGLKGVQEEVAGIRDWLPRRIDDRYELVHKVGEGGVGEVWKAIDRSTGTRVAVKLLRKKFTQDDQTRRRFMRESEIACSLHHPHVVETYDAGEDASGQLYLVMELLDGRTLRHVLDDRATGLPKWDVVRIGTAICEALIAAGELGIVHRDLKPENVCAPVGGGYKLADFGLGFVTSASAEERLQRSTEEGTLSGTPHYMAPEQCRGDLDITAAADIYSLGVLLFELATGHPPFRAPTVRALLISHCDAPRPVIPHLPLLSELVVEMLSINPADRPTPQRVLEALDAVVFQGDTLP